MTKRAWLLGLVAVAGGCGSGPVEDEPGEPIARLTGSLTGDLGGAEPESPFVGILWVNKAEDDETSSLAVDDVSPLGLQGPFELAIFDEPARDRVFPIESDTGEVVGEMAAGWLVALDDADANGAFTRIGWELQGGDRYLGVAWLEKVIWVGTQPPAEEVPWFTNAERLTPGFHVARTPCAVDPDLLEIVDPASPVEIALFDPIAALQEEALDDDFCP